MVGDARQALLLAGANPKGARWGAGAIAALLAWCMSAFPALAGNTQETSLKKGAESVVLLHGLGRTTHSMAPLAKALSAAGYRVHNIGYPSRTEPFDVLLRHLETEFERCCAHSTEKVHFVAYSLGGILTRAYLAEKNPDNLGRVVMLGPPNRGSEIVDTLGDTWLFKAAFGPAAGELGTSSDSLPNRIGPPEFELGIIAGNRSINPIGSWLISGDHDGSVSIESAKLEGMADFLVVPKNHTFIAGDPDVAEQVIHFLQKGSFAREPAGSEN